jgi:hypothetical protein
MRSRGTHLNDRPETHGELTGNNPATPPQRSPRVRDPRLLATVSIGNRRLYSKYFALMAVYDSYCSGRSSSK